MEERTRILEDGGLRLSAHDADELRRCLVAIEQALAWFDGLRVRPSDARPGYFTHADNARDLALARVLLQLLGRPGARRESVDLYPNEAQLFRLAEHNLFVALVVYDGGELESGESLDLTAALNSAARFSKITGEWPQPVFRGGRGVQRVR
jgi:hypothetical protein